MRFACGGESEHCTQLPVEVRDLPMITNEPGGRRARRNFDLMLLLWAHSGAMSSSMIRGVTRMIRSRRFSLLELKLNSFPMIGNPESKGMPERVLVTCGDGQPADDRGFAVVDQELVLGPLGLEDEAQVSCSERLDRRPLGVQLHGDLAVAGDVRRHRQPDTGLLEDDAGLGIAGGAGVDHADRRFLTDQDVGLPVVQCGDDRFGLDVGQVGPLDRAQERGEGESAQRGGEHQVDSRSGHDAAGVADAGQRVAAEVDDVDLGLVELAGGRDRSSAGPPY